MFKVTHGKVKFDGKLYGKNEEAGDVITGLSTKQEESLAKKNYGDIINTKSAGKSEDETKIIPDGATVPEVKKLIEKIDDIDNLYKMLEYEEAHENRKGVKEFLEEKIAELEEAKENGEESANININISPDEVVSD